MSPERVTINLSEKEGRIYDRLRAQVVERRPGETPGLRELLLLLPDCVVLLARLVREPQVPSGAKLVAAGALAYVLSPVDLLPELLLGPIGLIDDLLVAGMGISFLMNRVHPDLVRAHWPGTEDALESLQAVSSFAEEQLAGRVLSLLGRLRRLVR